MAGEIWQRDARGGAARARTTRALYGAAILATPPLAALHLARWAGGLDAASLLPAAAGLALGWLTADLATGLVHWACDTWGDERTPWLGPTLIRGFRDHHRDPGAMLASDWIDANGEPAAAACAGFALLALPGVQALLAPHAFVQAAAWSLLVWAALANQLHQWSHAARPPTAVARLQALGLVLSPERHARHHRGACTAAYCISSGALNGLLDRAGFWRALERGVARTTGAVPRRDAPPASPGHAPGAAGLTG